ncbi:MAG: 50S ribosomal protein L1 [Candidatus Thermoplasmatota archaeon]|nr:50S ribosomal protein L1 [Candidatus Thermoplasmatota archaeon]
MVNKTFVDAVENIKETAKENNRNFKQTIDVVINLKNIDLSIPKNRIDENVVLPHGRGSKAKVGLFASGQLALESKDLVDLLIKPEDLEDLADDKKESKKIADEYDFFLAEAPLMPTIGKTLGTVFGPRGKMPRPVPPQGDITDTVEQLRKTVKVRSKTNSTFHTIVGSEDMDSEKIAENIETIIKRVEPLLERGRMNIKSNYVKTTMGPSEKIL